MFFSYVIAVKLFKTPYWSQKSLLAPLFTDSIGTGCFFSHPIARLCGEKKASIETKIQSFDPLQKLLNIFSYKSSGKSLGMPVLSSEPRDFSMKRGILIGGLVDWWIGGLVDWWIRRCVD